MISQHTGLTHKNPITFQISFLTNSKTPARKLKEK